MQKHFATVASSKWSNNCDWIGVIPSALMPLVISDLLAAYTTINKKNRKKVIKKRKYKIKKRHIRDYLFAFRRLFRKVKRDVIKEVLKEFDRAGLGAVLTYLLELTHNRKSEAFMAFARASDSGLSERLVEVVVKEFERAGLGAALAYVLTVTDKRSAVIEALADAIDSDPSACTRAFWIAYGMRPSPERAQKIAKKLFKHGNITSAFELLRLGPPISSDRTVGELRLNASLFLNGVAMPPAIRSRRKEGGLKELVVAYVASSALPYQMTGYTARTHGLLRAIKAQGVHIRCYTRPGYPWDRRLLTSDDSLPEIHTLDQVEYTCTRIADISREPEQFTDRMSQALEQRLRAEMPQIVHAASNHKNGLPALMAARRLGLPFFYEMRGLWELTAATRKPQWEQTERFQLERSLELLIAKEADLVFTITGGLANELIANGVAEDKISLLPNAVDPELFSPIGKDENLQAQLGINSCDFVLVYAGTLNEYEGLDDLVKAVAILRSKGTLAKLIIVGDGPMRDELGSLAFTLGLKNTSAVIFCGVVPYDQARDYLALADVVALPRKPFKVCEIVTPLKPFEAMALAKPIVLSDLAASREIVSEGKTGRLCIPANPLHLANVLQELAVNSELRLRLGRAARDWVVANRSWAANASKLRELYATMARQ